MRFRPELDAFRGLCIAAVFLNHTHFFDCGWIGVQAFFVLSGYLITSILLDAKPAIGQPRDSRAYFVNFYVRRALRIFPVYFAYLAVVILALRLVDAPPAPALREYSDDILVYLLTYTVNLLYALTPIPTVHLYAHLWSLSIEEQFYLLWPLIVLLVDRRRLMLIAFVLVLAGPFFRLLEYVWINPAPFQRPWAGRVILSFTFSHLDAFAIGALLNFRDDMRVQKLVAVASRWALPAAVLVGLWMLALGRLAHYDIGATSLGWPAGLPYFYCAIWGYSLLNVLFMACIANASTMPSALRSRPVTRLGRVSYGFYIFHMPVLWFAHLIVGMPEGALDLLNVGVCLGAFAATWALAEVSFRYLETPFLNLRGRFVRTAAPVSTPALAATESR